MPNVKDDEFETPDFADESEYMDSGPDHAEHNALLTTGDGLWHERCARAAWDAATVAIAEISAMREGGAHGFACRGCCEALGDDE